MNKFEIYFLNNGSAVFQTSNYCHLYDDMKQLANDVKLYSGGSDTDQWDGNQSDIRINYYDSDNSGYIVIDQDDYYCLVRTKLASNSFNNINQFIENI